MRYLIIVAVVLWAHSGSPQSWQWSRHIGGPGPEAGGARIGGVDTDGNLYLYGSYAGSIGTQDYFDCYFATDTLHGSNDSFLAKYDPSGTLFWVKNCVSPASGISILDVVIDTVEQALFVVGGYGFTCNLDTCELTAPFSGAYLSKWTLDGSCLWAKNVATSEFGPYGIGLHAAVLSGEGRLMLAGVTAELGTTTVGVQSFAPGSFIASYDTDGNEIWSKQLVSYDFQEREYYLIELKYNGTNVIGYGPVTMYAGDTLALDTIELIDLPGSGYGLVSLDPESGIAQWLRIDGRPAAIPHFTSPQRMDLNENGDIYCVGRWSDTAIFDVDTLFATDLFAKGFVARYDSDGNKTLLREYLPTTGAMSFFAIDVADNGSVFLSGSTTGDANTDNCAISAITAADLLLLRLDSDGDCMGAVQGGLANGLSVLGTTEGVYTTGVFSPFGGPTATTTFGSETYESHGWEDILFAKHEVITSTPQPIVVEDDGLHIYANPNRGSFRLRLPTALANAPELFLRIYNSSGQLVREQQLQMDEERPRMDVWDVGPGLYNITVTNGRRTYSGSMVVE